MTPICPTAALLARFPGLYIPILDFSFNGPAPTDTQFDTVEINRQYDGFADFPLYPLNSHRRRERGSGHRLRAPVRLRRQPGSRSDGTAAHPHRDYGDTDYYFFETEDLPLFGPLRTLGVPEP